MTPAKTTLEAFDAFLANVEHWGWDEEINTIKQVLTANTWRDIKDAPRDGTRILIWDKNMGASRVMFWAHGEEEDGDCWFVDAMHGRYAFRALPELTKSGNLTKWQPITKPEQPPC